jgi:protein-S-isoprenylcysteine O-methyltransferase Ste14
MAHEVGGKDRAGSRFSSNVRVGGGHRCNMRDLELKVPPLIVVAIAAAFMWAIARAAPNLTLLYPGRVPVATAFLVIGIAIVVMGVLAFRRSSTTVDPRFPENASHIVSSGIYRYTRNPMYLGMLVVLIAWMALLSNVGTVVMPALFVLYITRWQIVPEERALAQKFGAEYELYRKSVRRWL